MNRVTETTFLSSHPFCFVSRFSHRGAAKKKGKIINLRQVFSIYTLKFLDQTHRSCQGEAKHEVLGEAD